MSVCVCVSESVREISSQCFDGLLWYLILWCFYCTNLETRFSTARGKFRVRSWSLMEIKTQCVQVYIIKRIVIHSERVDTTMCSVPSSSLGLYPCELHGYNNTHTHNTPSKHAKSESKTQTTSKWNFANTHSLHTLLRPVCVWWYCVDAAAADVVTVVCGADAGAYASTIWTTDYLFPI